MVVAGGLGDGVFDLVALGHDIVEEVYPIDGEPIIDKPGKGAFYATDLAAGRLPSKRQIKREWPVGYDSASDLHDHLAAAMAAT